VHIPPPVFLTNHALVLILIWRQPDVRIKTIAERVGITERAAHRILKALVARGCLESQREGRTNRYLVRPNVQLRHPLVARYKISELLKAVGGDPGDDE